MSKAAWYDRLLGMQMSRAGVSGVLIASPDPNTYKLKQDPDGTTVLVQTEHALLAKRMQLDGLTIDFGARGKGKVRALEGTKSTATDAGTCVVEWDGPNKQPSDVPFTDVLEHELDVFLGLRFKKSYDGDQTYNLTIATSVVQHGERFYESNFDDGDVDVIAKDEILRDMDPEDFREIVIRLEDVLAAAAAPSPATAAVSNEVNVRFWSQSIHLLLAQYDNDVRVRELLTNPDDGSKGEALASGLIDVGDKVIAINGKSVETMDVDTVAKIISTSLRPIVLRFVKQAPIADVVMPDPAPAAALPAAAPSSSGWNELMVELRDAVAAGEPVEASGGDVVFYTNRSNGAARVERRRAAASASTGFINKATRKPYDLVTVVTYIKYRYLSFAEYVRRCRAETVDIISPADIKQLMLFLNGREPMPVPPPAVVSSGPTAIPITPPPSSSGAALDCHANIQDDDETPPTPKRKRGNGRRKTTTDEDGDDDKDNDKDNDGDDEAAAPRLKSKRVNAAARNSTKVDVDVDGGASTPPQVVSVTVQAQGLKMSLIDGYKNRYPILNGFNRGPDGMGEVEASGKVSIGAELTHVNTTHVARMTVAAVADLIRIVKRPIMITFKNREKKN
ncbi:Aste57867_5632 [Aphanomyces stellatus]|uniref:Aste57867_5632 protein n=1 Tax=Aphanomyces stellatus TaxID=120398 RepID=A0A485KFP3_9STRA|nr:hypothetical protein As57867_005619 [Aphanomyces stellatus]VFT82678.1 Aste57867_5632 [Aphanomyces stellatus]